MSLSALPAGALDLGDLGARLLHIDCYRDTATYEVLLASLAEPAISEWKVFPVTLTLILAPDAGD